MDKYNILILCVHYKNEQDVLTYIGELSKQTIHNEICVIVTDNSGELIENEFVRKCKNFPITVFLYKPGSNLGYYGAAAWALDKYLEDYRFPDWIVVSNTDILLPDPKLFDQVKTKYSKNAPAVITPRITTQDGMLRNEHTVSRPSHMKSLIYRRIVDFYVLALLHHFISFLRLRYKIYVSANKMKTDNSQGAISSETRVVYAPAGSFTIFSKNYFKSNGSLEYGAFLYGEEAFVAETVKENNEKVIYDPQLHVIHAGYATTNFFKAPKILNYKRDAVRFLYDRYFKHT